MFGRRGCIFITALILIATPIGSGFTQSWQTLFVVRLIMGVGMGAKGSTVPIMAAENVGCLPDILQAVMIAGPQLTGSPFLRLPGPRIHPRRAHHDLAAVDW